MTDSIDILPARKGEDSPKGIVTDRLAELPKLLSVLSDRTPSHAYISVSLDKIRALYSAWPQQTINCRGFH